MAEEDLVARLRATGQTGFSRAMRKAARDVSSVGDESDDVTVSARGLARQLNRTSGSSEKMGSSLASATTTVVASRGVIAGLTVGVIALAAALGSPLLASLGAATAGLGALGVAAGGVMVPAMLLAIGVTQRWKDTAHIAGSGAHDLRGALEKLKHTANRAISPAAARMMHALADAARTLAPVVRSLRQPFLIFAKSAGGAVREVARGVRELGPEIRRLVRGAGGVLRAFAPAVAPFLGILLDIANAAMPSLVRAARAVTSTLRGWRAYFADTDRLKDSIRGLVGHLGSWMRLGGGVLRIMIGLGRALMPTGKSWVDSLADGAHSLGDFLNSARGMGAVRGVFFGILGAIKSVGRFIGVLVGVAKSAGSRLLEAFRPAMPFFENVLGPLVLGFAKGVLSGVVAAFNVLVPVIGLLAKGLGWLGTKAAPLKGVFEGVGQVLGFIFAGPILKLLGAIPKLGIVFNLVRIPIRLLGRAVGVVAGFLGRVFGPALSKVGSVFKTVTGVIVKGVKLWLGAHRIVLGLLVKGWLKLGGLLLGAAKGAIGKVWSFLRGLGSTAFRIGKGIVGGIARGIAGAPGALIDALKGVVRKAVDALPGPIREAAGAVLGIFDGLADGTGPQGVRRSGPYVVGEKGVEVVNLKRGDHVTPNARLGAAPRGRPGGRALIELRVVAELDRRAVGRGVARIAADDLARP